MIRLLPSDPRFAAYNELQQTLTLALNTHVHWNLARLPVDPLLWKTEQLPDLCADVTVEMWLMAGGMRDE